MRWIYLSLIVPVGFVLWWGCATPKPSKSAQLKTKMSPEEQKKLDEYRAEIEIGRNMAGRLLAYYGVVQDKALAGYLNQVGSYVAGYGDYPDRRYMFQILDSDMANAFACPGGYILVTKGAIARAKNEAELAHILGHEVAHVGLKHMFETLKGMSKDEMDKAAEEAEKKAFGESQYLKARRRPKPVESETGAMLAKYLSGSSAGLSVLSAAKAGMSLILEKGLGAEKEYEADSEGTKYAVNAGYHPRALMNYLCRLEQKKKGKKGKKSDRCRLPKVTQKKKKKTVLDKTHPAVAMRVEHIRKTLTKLEALNAPGAKGKKRFLKYHKRLKEL